MGDASMVDAREALKLRLIPTMTLSTASNPLTAPLPSLATVLTPAERASERFAIHGAAVITGGAGGLALAAARALLEHGLSAVMLLDLGTTLANSVGTIAALAADFPQATICHAPVDVTNEDKVALAMETAYQQLGRIDILCCFAGVVGCTPSLQVNSKEWNRIINVNLTGSFICAQAAAKYMIASANGGTILFIASMSGHLVNFPQPQAAYNVSKAGILHLKSSLAAEWAQYGIRVNSISPGYMDTVLNAGDGLQGVRDVWAARCPMGRMGNTDELTGAVVMLCSRRAGRYITGTDLIIDGGTSCF